MKENKIVRNVSKYTIFEKEITDEVIIDDLITGNKLTQISFSYETETLIKFMYYCLNYFFKNKTYGENLFRIELYNDNYNNNSSYLFKFKMLLPHIFKIIIKYLSINNKWFNFMFNGYELINLIQFLDTKNAISFDYNSLLNYLLNIKYRLLDNQLNINHEILYSNWPNILLNGISNIIAELFYYNKNFQLFKKPKDKIFNLLGFNEEKNKVICKICKLFPTNLIYFKCGHFFCYYCYFYKSKVLNSKEILNEQQCVYCKNIKENYIFE